MDEIERVSQDTTYNNQAYLGAGADALVGGQVKVQVGYNDGDVIDVGVYNIHTGNLGHRSVDAGTGAVTFASDTANESLTWDDAGTKKYLDITLQQTLDGSGAVTAPGALQVISDAITQVASYKAEWGALQNRLEYTVSNLMNVVEFTSAARSRIQDADFAVEAANLAKAQVLQQTGTAMLAQANAAPQLALQLLQ